MQTIQLQIEDSLYEKLVKNNVDIAEEVYRHLEQCVEDDGYPAISFEEAKKRVTEAVEDYRENGSKNCTPLDKSFWDERKERILKKHQQKVS